MMKLLKSIYNKLFVRKIIIKQPIFLLKEPQNLLQGKIALVTGGTSGIGYSISKQMIDAGATVYIVGRNVEKLKAAAEKLNSHWLCVDINNIGEMTRVIGKLMEAVDIDILVNSAGTHGNDQFLEVEEKTFDKVMSANVKALYFLSQLVANQMIKKNIRGHILNVSSASSVKPSWTPYEISKRAVNGITEGMAHKLIQYGIVVNGIAPGPTLTPMLLSEDNLDWPCNPSGRMSTVEEVSALALFLVSSRGDGVVGDTFFISGGSGTIDKEK